MSPGEFLLLLTLLLLLLGLVEAAWHRLLLRSIPLIIHVNGTRGKSGAVRLIAAGLRAGGLRAVAKTTGAEARWIDAAGIDHPIRRRGRPTIREQLYAVRRAAKEGADALVVECMAIGPEYQWVSQHRMIRSPLTVITTVRPDHGEVFNGDPEALIEALALTLPPGGILVTAEGTFFDALSRKAEAIHCQVRRSPTSRTFKDLPAWVLEENLSLAVSVCEAVGVAESLALPAMLQATADPGALSCCRLQRGEAELLFVNAFSANDPMSVNRLWEVLRSKGILRTPTVAVIASRADRPHRGLLFARWSAEALSRGEGEVLPKIDHVLFIGPLSHLLARKGDPFRSLALPAPRPSAILETLWTLLPEGGTAVGLGNLGGTGRALWQHILKEGERQW